MYRAPSPPRESPVARPCCWDFWFACFAWYRRLRGGRWRLVAMERDRCESDMWGSYVEHYRFERWERDTGDVTSGYEVECFEVWPLDEPPDLV